MSDKMVERYDQNAILAYVEGEMPDDERSAFEQQMATDESLQQLTRDMIGDRAALLNLPDEPTPSGLTDAAIGQIERQMLLCSDPAATEPTLAGPIPISTATAPRKPRPARNKWIGYGTIAAVLGISSAVILQSLRDTDRPPSSQPASGPFALDTLPPPPPQSAAPSPTRKTNTPSTDLLFSDSVDGDSNRLAGRNEVGTRDNESTSLKSARAAVISPSETDQDQPASAIALTDAVLLRRKLSRQLDLGDPEAEPTAVSDAKVVAVQVAYRIDVAASHTDQTRQQILRWALSNNVRVLSETTVNTAAKTRFDAVKLAGKAGVPNAPDSSALQQVIVELEEAQLGLLVQHLKDNPANQRTSLARTRGRDAAEIQPTDAVPTPSLNMIGLERTESESRLAEDESKDERADSDDDAEKQRSYYFFDWAAVLQTQVPLVPVHRLTDVSSDNLPTPGTTPTTASAHRINVLIEVTASTPDSETAAQSEATANQPAEVDDAEASDESSP